MKGRKVLVVEDEVLLAMDIEAMLQAEGCDVLEPVGSVARALAVLGTDTPDIASLDMNLNGKSSAPIAAALKEKGVPFIVVTGYGGWADEDPVFGAAPLVRKPFDSSEYIRVLAGLLA